MAGMPAPTRRRKACEPCRQQKIRCDAEPPDVCSRCRRMGLRCVLATNSSSRRTKAQLQQDVEQLREQALAASSAMKRQSLSASQAIQVVDPQPSLPVQPGGIPCGQVDSVSLIISPRSNQDLPLVSDDEHCRARRLDGQDVEAWKIRDCFRLFFRDYYSAIPVFDHDLSPDETYEQSPFLFWAIVFVGSRRYAQDPTLLGRLTARINSMALLSLESRSRPIETIKGLLLLCLWPIPLNTMHKDISQMLSSAAMHLAMHVGLHIAGRGQDFVRFRIDRDRAQDLSRAHLWMHCLFVFHTTIAREGMSPMVIADPEVLSLSDESLDAGSNAQFRLRRKMLAILAESRTVLVRNIPTASTATKSALGPLIALFDSRLQALAREVQSPDDSIHLSCCRIHVLAFHFLESPAFRDNEGLVQLYALSCAFTDDIIREHRKRPIIDFFTVFVERTVMLAVTCVLKIHRSELAPYIDLVAGEKAYFAAIRVHRQTSLENDDIGARGFSILSQLWTSPNTFRKSNGRLESLDTHIRSRLSMSVVFDCFWWWREEFAGHTSPYLDESRRTSPKPPAVQGEASDMSLEQSLGPPVPEEPGQDAALLFPGEPFPDYDWAANMDFRDFDTIPLSQWIGDQGIGDDG